MQAFAFDGQGYETNDWNSAVIGYDTTYFYEDEIHSGEPDWTIDENVEGYTEIGQHLRAPFYALQNAYHFDATNVFVHDWKFTGDCWGGLNVLSFWSTKDQKYVVDINSDGERIGRIRWTPEAENGHIEGGYFSDALKLMLENLPEKIEQEDNKNLWLVSGFGTLGLTLMALAIRNCRKNAADDNF